MGGYENNPILLDSVPNDFNFGLYELDYSVFDTHIEGAVKLCPTFGTVGIKSTICGPESFTPDHKPLMVQFDFISQLWLTLIIVSTSFRAPIHTFQDFSIIVVLTQLEWCWVLVVQSN